MNILLLPIHTKHQYLTLAYSHKAFKGTVVNHTCCPIMGGLPKKFV